MTSFYAWRAYERVTAWSERGPAVLVPLREAIAGCALALLLVAYFIAKLVIALYRDARRTR